MAGAGESAAAALGQGEGLQQAHGAEPEGPEWAGRLHDQRAEQAMETCIPVPR